MKARAQIALFLREAKRIVKKNGFILVPRDENFRFMSQHSLRAADIEEIILKLREADCFDGPEPDRDPKRSSIWTVAEFCPFANGEKLYLKLSIALSADLCKCLSVKLFTERPHDEDL